MPCVIGTRIGTKVLQNGDYVLVDAAKGVVEILQKYQTFDDSISIKTKKPVTFNLDFRLPTTKAPKQSTPLIIGFGEEFCDNVKLTGGKGSSLAKSVKTQLPVPPGFCVSSEVFQQLLVDTGLVPVINGMISEICDHNSLSIIARKIQSLIEEITIPYYIQQDLMNHFLGLESNLVAVRSSALEEDSKDCSWAGQLESYLNTTQGDLVKNIKKCWASMFSERALIYRHYQGAKSDNFGVAVVVQKMIDSRLAGTAFSKHPVTQRLDEVFIESCIGLGETLVLGKVIPTTYTLNKETMSITSYSIEEQKVSLKRSTTGSGTQEHEVCPEEQPLSGDEAIAIARLVCLMESHHGFPLDIEWAYEGNKLYILQSRPITT